MKKRARSKNSPKQSKQRGKATKQGKHPKRAGKAKRSKPRARKARAAEKAKYRGRSTTTARALPVARVGAAQPVSVGIAEQEALRAKFELGPPEWTRVLDLRERTQTIPWGYGRDTVVAMPIDPERLYLYWEVTDEAIARARTKLGTDGEHASLSLRVHDVTDLLFDGGNSHHHFDVAIARADRQWFLDLHRPTATVVVELGLLAPSGAFSKIARSHRADFPRRDPAPLRPAHAVEWLTVRAFPSAQGRSSLHLEPGGAVPGPKPSAGGGGPSVPDPNCSNRSEGPFGSDDDGSARSDRSDRDVRFAAGDANSWAAEGEWSAMRSEWWLVGAPWSDDAPPDLHEIQFAEVDRSLVEWLGADFLQKHWEFGASGWKWTGPVLEEHWESGPFEFATPIAATTMQRGDDRSESHGDRGGATATAIEHEPRLVVQTWRGFTRVRQGPWRLEFRGLDPRGGGRVLARWEVRRSWISSSGHERIALQRWKSASTAAGDDTTRRHAGASEQLGASEQQHLGASERRWVGGSEMRLGGASEQRWLGASERRLGAQQELAYGGASERRMIGASERRLRGGSERRLAGASERRLAGASERRLAAGSEQRLGGASEQRGRGSEGRLKRPN
jgi:hypothetical protein